MVIETQEHGTVRHEAPSRRLEEIRELEELWSVPLEESEPATSTRSELLRQLRRHRVGLAFAAVWLAFMTVLMTLGPSAGAVATPGWAEQVAGVLLTALLLAPLGLFNRTVGYGAATVAGVAGISLAVGCFAGGHTGFWSSFQLVGFGALAAASAVAIKRSQRSPETS